MGDDFVWTGADTLPSPLGPSPLGSSATNLDDPLNWFDTTTGSVAVHAPQATDTAVFTASTQRLFPGGIADGSGGFIVTNTEFSPATLEIMPGAHVVLASGESPPEYIVGTLNLETGASLALAGSSMSADVANISTGSILDLSQAFWIGAPSKGPPGAAETIGQQAAAALGYPGPLNAVLGNLTIAQGGSVVLGNRDVGVATFDNQNAAGTGNLFAPLKGVSGSGTLVDKFEQGPFGGVGQATIDFGTVVLGQTAVATLTIHSGPGDLGFGDPVGAIQTHVNGGNITDPDLSGAGVTAHNFGTTDYQPGGPVSVASFAITLDAQHVGALQGQAVNLAFALNGGQYGPNILVPITGNVVAGPGGVATIVATTPGQVVSLGSGANMVFATAPIDVEQTGGANTIVSNGGAMTLNATAGGSLIFHTAGGDLLNEGPVAEFVAGPTSAASTINATAGGSDTIFAVTSALYNGLRGANSLFVGGTGASTVVAAANETLFGGTGGGTYTPGAEGFFLFAGGGSDSVSGGSAAPTVWGNSNERLTAAGTAGHGVFVAFGENDSINASAAGGGNAFIAVDQALSIPAGTFTGNTTLVGSSAGGDTFGIFGEPGTPPPAHRIVIENWQASDTLFLGNYGSADVAAANRALAGAAAGSATFVLSDHTTVAFLGSHPSSTAA